MAEKQLSLEKKIKTYIEVGKHSLKVLAPIAVAYLGTVGANVIARQTVGHDIVHPEAVVQFIADTLQTAGLASRDILLHFQAHPELLQLVKDAGPFSAGLVTGLAQNIILERRTLDKLLDPKHPATVPGTFEALSQTSEEANFAYHCVDKRRVDKKGLAGAGAHGLMGANIKNLAEAGLINKLGYGTAVAPATSFLAGYAVGSNLKSAYDSHKWLFEQLDALSVRPEYKGKRLNVEMFNHLEGCGAEGMTNPITHLAKFDWHNLGLVDLMSAPNEIAGWAYANTALSLLLALKYKGRVNLSASLTRHTEMAEVKSH